MTHLELPVNSTPLAGPQGVSCTALSRRDLPELARVHMAAFPHSLLARIGVEAVTRNYDSLLTSQTEVIGLAATLDGKMAGFAFGGVFRSELTRFVRPNALFLASRVVLKPHLVLAASGRQRIATGLRALLGISTPRPSGVRVPPAGAFFGIQAIAVDPSVQGHGIGRRLMAAMEQEARSRQFTLMLLTVHADNMPALSFYLKLGWRKLESESGEWDGVLVKPLPPLS